MQVTRRQCILFAKWPASYRRCVAKKGTLVFLRPPTHSDVNKYWELETKPQQLCQLASAIRLTGRSVTLYALQEFQKRFGKAAACPDFHFVIVGRRACDWRRIVDFLIPPLSLIFNTMILSYLPSLSLSFVLNGIPLWSSQSEVNESPALPL